MNVRFGEFRFDSDTRQLYRRDAEVHLSPKAFELLQMLLEARPKAVSKAELSERLWPATFVSEANLSVLIAEIRGALRQIDLRLFADAQGDAGSDLGREAGQIDPQLAVSWDDTDHTVRARLVGDRAPNLPGFAARERNPSPGHHGVLLVENDP